MQLRKNLTTKIFLRVLKQLTHVTNMNLICEYCKGRINIKKIVTMKTLNLREGGASSFPVS